MRGLAISLYLLATGPAAMVTSNQGVDFIKRWERFSPVAYNDGGGYQTIGYGHLILDTDPDFSAGVDEEHAESLLRDDVSFAEKSLRRLAGDIEFKQNEWDALVSFVFNIGENKIKRQGRNTLAALKSGDFKRLAIQMRKWVNSGGVPLRGLARRREAEVKMLLDGDYGEGP